MSVSAEESRRLIVLEEFSLSEIKEPSGLCYNPENNSLFVVGDQGDVAEISLDGKILKHCHFPGRDFEGITLAGSVLYALEESNFQIVTLDPFTLTLVSTHQITRDYGPFEGISHYPDGSKLLVNQIKKPEKDIAGILFLNGSTLEPDGRFIETGIIDQADIFTGSDTDSYYIISDKMDRLYYFSLSDGLLWDLSLPGNDQEGIAVDRQGFFYMAQDSGGVLRLKLE